MRKSSPWNVDFSEFCDNGGIRGDRRGADRSATSDRPLSVDGKGADAIHVEK